MNHERHKLVHFNITDSPSTAWTAQQIVNAFPYDSAPKYLLRDRDSIYGSIFKHRVGRVIEMPKVGGLHHQYLRQAACGSANDSPKARHGRKNHAQIPLNSF